MMHETTWFGEDVGAPAAASCRVAEGWADDGRSVASRRLLESLGLSLEAGVGPRWGQGADGQARAGASAQAPGRTVPTVAGVVAERGRRQRVSQRTVDVGSHRRGDWERVRSILSPQSCVTAASPALLVLPGPGVAGHTARRGRDRPLGAVSLAAYKKRPPRTWGPSGLPG